VCDPQFPKVIGDHCRALQQQQQASSHQDVLSKRLTLQTHGYYHQHQHQEQRYYRQHRRHEQLKQQKQKLKHGRNNDQQQQRVM
jgi:hypothetical protein